MFDIATHDSNRNQDRAASTPDPLRILIVEDEEATSVAMKRFFEFNGHRVAVAATGREALAEFREHQPDVVVTDWVLQDGEDGLEVARKLQAESGPSIVMVTAHRLEHVREKAAAMGVEIKAFRRKPVSLPALVELVENLAAEAA